MFILVICSWSALSRAQDITVHVFEERTKLPVEDIYLNLRSDCFNSNRPKSLQQKTGSSGTAIFKNVSLAGQPLCLDLFSVKYASMQLDYIFASADKGIKGRNPVITSLPAEVTFRVRHRTFLEQLQFLFRGE